MPNPELPPPTNPQVSQAKRLAQLERDVANLQRLIQQVAIPVYDTLPAPGRQGRVAMLSSDSSLWKDTGSVWAAV